MSPREDDFARYIAPPWSMSPSMAKMASRLNELEDREGVERRNQIVKYAHEGPWPLERWMDALDSLHHRHSRWQMIEEAWKIGLGPNFAVVLSDLLDIEKRDRPKIKPWPRVNWFTVIIVLALAVMVLSPFIGWWLG